MSITRKFTENFLPKTTSRRWHCHAKIGPPQSRSGRTDFGKKNLPKSVRPDQFWQPKLVPPCQFRSPRGTDFGKKLSAKISPPSLIFPILHYRAIPLGTCVGSYSYSYRLTCRTGIFCAITPVCMKLSSFDQLHATCKASHFEARMLHAYPCSLVHSLLLFTIPCTIFYDAHLAIASWRGTDFGKKLSAKIGPPSLLFPILHYRTILLGTCIGSYSYN